MEEELNNLEIEQILLGLETESFLIYKPTLIKVLINKSAEDIESFKAEDLVDAFKCLLRVLYNVRILYF
jgi:hypothetical protein